MNGLAADAAAVGDLDTARALAATAGSWSEPSLGGTSSTTCRFAGYRADIHEAFLKLACLPHLLVVILLAALSTSGMGGRVGPHGQSKGS